MSQASAASVREFTLAQVMDGLRTKGLTPDAVPDDFDLLLEGVIDSFGLLELITAVETRFGVHLDFEDINGDNITVVGPFSRYVAGKIGQ